MFSVVRVQLIDVQAVQRWACGGLQTFERFQKGSSGGDQFSLIADASVRVEFDLDGLR